MQRVLVALDGSPRSPAVLAAATALARARGGRLSLFRAVGLPPDVPQDFWKTSEEPLIEVLRRRAQAYLEEIVKTVPAELRAPEPVEIAMGVPWQAVCDAAIRSRADLVVIGSHGYAGLDRVIGTTAAKIVNHATCSVLVVREPLPVAVASA
jgi:nucleotide-binding universal stress UspA family protein